MWSVVRACWKYVGRIVWIRASERQRAYSLFNIPHVIVSAILSVEVFDTTVLSHLNGLALKWLTWCLKTQDLSHLNGVALNWLAF